MPLSLSEDKDSWFVVLTQRVLSSWLCLQSRRDGWPLRRVGWEVWHEQSGNTKVKGEEY